MKPLWRYSLFGLLAFLLFVVILFPADRMYAWLQQRGESSLQLYQVSGTVWQGQVGRLRVAGFDLENVGWQLHPWALLMGRLEMEVGIAGAGADVGLVLGRNLSGSYFVRQRGEFLAMTALEALLNKQPYGLTGEISLDLDDIRLIDGKLENITGSLHWRQAGLAEPLDIQVGDFELSLETLDGVLQGTLTDNGGPLQAEGILMLSADNSYRLTLTLRSRDKSRSDIKQALRMLGTPSPEGKVSLVRRGRLDFSTFMK